MLYLILSVLLCSGTLAYYLQGSVQNQFIPLGYNEEVKQKVLATGLVTNLLSETETQYVRTNFKNGTVQNHWSNLSYTSQRCWCPLSFLFVLFLRFRYLDLFCVSFIFFACQGILGVLNTYTTPLGGSWGRHFVCPKIQHIFSYSWSVCHSKRNEKA